MEMGVPVLATFCLVCQILIVHGFNIDVRYSIFKEGATEDDYFGYSVAQHSPDEASSTANYILVGSPIATSSHVMMRPHMRTGALYKCPIDLTNAATKLDDCEELSYPNTTYLRKAYDNEGDSYYENKTDMWLGVNIKSAGLGQDVVACAHRYKLVERDVNVYGIGVCYKYAPDLTLIPDKDGVQSPCVGLALVDTVGRITGKAGLCAAGMGLAAMDNSIAYGVPGLRTSGGAAYFTKKVPFPDTSIGKMITSEAGPPYTGYYAYLGSSAVLVRNLVKDHMPVVVLGAPKGNDTGVVRIFDVFSEFEILRSEYMGDQYGSGFGHSVEVVDIKNDEHPSLIVGAPFYRYEAVDTSSERTGAGGAVYFYPNYGNGIDNDTYMKITPGPCRVGPSRRCANAQFGYSISSLGDINGDGLNDIAVGAPFYGSGAVFVYNGQINGELSTEASQVILASDLKGPLTRDLSGFGISLSGGHDMDGQGYADIAIGAHASSHVVILRTRPVVTIQGTIKVSPGMLDPTKIECPSDDLPTATCIEFETCFEASYSDAGNTKDGSDSVTIKYTLTGDSGYGYPSNRRVVFNLTRAGEVDSVKTDTFITVLDGAQRCEQQKVYIPTQYMRDFVKPVKFDMTTDLVISDDIQFDNIDARPILDRFGPSTPTAKIDFKRECKTPTCRTDLAVAAMFTDTANVIPVKDSGRTSNNEFVFDSNRVKKLNLTVMLNVDAAMDRAYESSVYIFLEPELWYEKTAYQDNQTTSCNGYAELNYVACTFHREILEGKDRMVILTLGINSFGSGFSTINITANTTSDDTVLSNNGATLKVKVNVVTDLELLGSVTQGDNVKYGGGDIKGASAMKRDDDIGDLVKHIYTILNSDGGSVPLATLNVQWPYEIASSGGYLLYMTQFPKIVGSKKAQCQVGDEYINKLGLELVDISGDDMSDALELRGLRRKRAIDKNTAAVKTYKTNEGTTRRIAELNCYDKTATCFTIKCEFHDIKPNQVIKVTFTSRLWNSSLTTDFGSSVDLVRVTSNGQLFIDPTAKVSQTNTTNDVTNVTTLAQPHARLTTADPGVEIWIIIVAVVVGVVLLVGIVLLLWKCGFFKRNRPMTYGVKVEKQKNEATTAYKQVPQNEPDHTLT